MSWIVWLAVAGVGVGIAAVVIMPGDDKIPYGVIAGSLAMLVTALVVQTSLPFLPWIFAALCLLGAVWLGLRWAGRLKKGTTT